MQVYMFLNVEPGKAASVMDAITGSGRAARAVAVTGAYDVIARVEDISWDDLEALACDELGRIDGVVSSTTSISLDARALTINPPPLPIFRSRELRSALVFIKLAPGAGKDALVALARLALDDSSPVVGAVILMGEHDVVLQVPGETPEDIAQIVLDHIYAVPGVGETTTSLILRATPEAGD